MLNFIIYWILGLIYVMVIGNLEILDEYKNDFPIWLFVFCLLIVLSLFWPMYLVMGIYKGFMNYMRGDE